MADDILKQTTVRLTENKHNKLAILGKALNKTKNDLFEEAVDDLLIKYNAELKKELERMLNEY